MSAEFEVLKYVTAVLVANIDLQARGVYIHTENHADVIDPQYPLITLELLANLDDRLVQEVEVEINVWSQVGGVEKWEIHDIVRDALLRKSGDSSGAWVVSGRKVCSIGNLDEAKARLYRVLARYIFPAVEK